MTNTTLVLLSETVPGPYSNEVARTYDSQGRSAGFSLEEDYTATYGYDAVGRFSTLTSVVASLTNSVTYGYLADSDLPMSRTFGSGMATTNAFESDRDLITQVLNKYNATIVSQYDYGNDEIVRRTSVKQSGTAFDPVRPASVQKRLGPDFLAWWAL